MNNVSDAIAGSILFVQSATKIWPQLKKRFSMSNGSRKYQLSKELYSIKQDGSKISDYYTKIKAIWEKLDAMNEFPRLSTIADDVNQFLTALARQKEEQNSFNF